jgi:hypothetical protein
MDAVHRNIFYWHINFLALLPTWIVANKMAVDATGAAILFAA